MDIHQIQRNISSDNVDFFKALPDAKSVLNIRHPRSGDTAMHIACRCGSIAVLKYFLNDLQASTEVVNADGKRPLHDAAQYSQEGSVRILLEHGSVLDPLKRADWTPLMLACTKRSESIVTMLLKAGADPRLRNKDGWNSFHIACREGHLDVVLALYDSCPDVWNTKSNNLRTPLHTAALHGHKDLVLWMLQNCHYRRDERDSCGTTPLMDACRVGHIDVAQLLIEYHMADVSLKDKTGRQAIHHAAQTGKTSAIKFLVEKCGVSVEAKSELTKETPLDVAVKEGQTETVALLRRLGDNLT
ncbi:unnamed protein product [Candidula unifasciata]|uniref:Ankyrin repeat domain-containing protein 16 n=1 Tax=Candidula unifasciata TaxID=100452 RepID=A0A8S3ZXT3_9EUPU|nr:unnamed protein product [Candidula unifasciata]